MHDRCEHLMAELALSCPEMAPALARVHLTELTPDELLAKSNGFTSVAMIDRTGTGFISSQLLDDNPHLARMVIAHESMHLVAERVARVEDLAGPSWDGDYQRANIALDRWINQILIDTGICTKSDIERLGGFVPNQGMEEADLMDIWRAETVRKSKGALGGCAPAGGDPTETETEASGREQEAHGILGGLASYSPSLRKMIAPPPPQVRWQDVLAEAAAAAKGAGHSARPRQTRAKCGRRGTEEVPKPGISSRKPQLVVVVDVSGSMTGLLDQVIAETEYLSAAAAVRLVLHDAAVLFSGEYKRGRDKISPAGGTDFGPAIRESEKHAREWPGRSVVVHLTDGFPCGEWPDVPSTFAAGFCGVVGGYDVSAPGRWRTRHVSGGGKAKKR